MANYSLLSAVSRRLEGKVAIITGGASGIGAFTAKVFANHGANVFIADLQDDLGRSVCESIGETSCKYVHCDVTDESQVKTAVEKAVKAYGKLDIMFNNAGIIDEYKPRIIDNKKADFERVLSVDVTGVFLGIKHAAQAMIPARSGSIIVTASMSSCVGGVATHALTAAKHAVVGLTKNVAVELGQFGIRVNSLSPSVVATPPAMTFLGVDHEEGVENLASSVANLKHVTLKAEDVANAALFLASDEGRYISGHNLVIDGGFSVVNPSFHMFQYPEN
ncbi:secoisolariciresinol dehydrogenase-like [Morus notabilis]|uniref:secoisolariciresinol dehydrogenase-like n=1 Tax=Morus notabilis TaxID=981085 RepID=UPI000CED2D0F|nr:secoisolariciresinol dehydrogenase-like [Morus notabilis]XP_024026831.1 secoisolariciresinol dehydrogenase-like [Morus notabilis]XP_024026832.1 secoisolariciresinol dehydrogenase-like [Morus notabilis]